MFCSAGRRRANSEMLPVHRSRLDRFMRTMDDINGRMTWTQFRLLLILADERNYTGLSCTNLAKQLSVSVGAISRAADVLGTKGRLDKETGSKRSTRALGYLHRREDPVNHKNVLLTLSPAGRDFLGDMETVLWGDNAEQGQ